MTKDVKLFAGDLCQLNEHSVEYPLAGYFGRNRARFYRFIESEHVDFKVLSITNGIAATDLIVDDKDLDSPLFFATNTEECKIEYGVIDLTTYQSKLPVSKGTLELDLRVFDGMYGKTADELRNDVLAMFNASSTHEMDCFARFLGNPHDYIVTAVDPIKRKVTVRYNSTYAGELPVDKFCVALCPGYYGSILDVIKIAKVEKTVWSPSKSMLVNKYQKFIDDQEQIVDDLTDVFVNHKYDKCELVSQPEAEDRNYLMRLTDKSNVFVSTNKGDYIFQRGALIDNFAKRIFDK